MLAETVQLTTRKPTLTVDVAHVLQFARPILRQVKDLNERPDPSSANITGRAG